MADRSSAEIFGTVFSLLAKRITPEKVALAKELWPACWEYDFNQYQMDCDEALVKLGLAEDRGEEMVYKARDGETWET